MDEHCVYQVATHSCVLLRKPKEPAAHAQAKDFFSAKQHCPQEAAPGHQHVKPSLGRVRGCGQCQAASPAGRCPGLPCLGRRSEPFPTGVLMRRWGDLVTAEQHYPKEAALDFKMHRGLSTFLPMHLLRMTVPVSTVAMVAGCAESHQRL